MAKPLLPLKIKTHIGLDEVQKFNVYKDLF